MVSWVDVSDGRDRGLALFCRTNKEFGLEPQDGNATIVLSLLRAVDGTFPMDPYVMVEVTDPFAQCLGEQTFEYALLPHSGDWRSAQLPQLCAQYLSPCVAMELSKGSREGSLPLGQASLFRFERSQVCFSGVKPSEDGLSWIIRVFNPTDETVSDVLVLLRRPSAVQEVRLDETPIRDIPIADDGAVPLKVLPHRILTCAVRFGEYPLR
jgi:alpha-mannosidase